MTHLSVHILDDLGEGCEYSGSLFGTLDYVVDGVGEWCLLEATVNVPSGTTDLGATASTYKQINVLYVGEIGKRSEVRMLTLRPCRWIL